MNNMETERNAEEERYAFDDFKNGFIIHTMFDGSRLKK